MEEQVQVQVWNVQSRGQSEHVVALGQTNKNRVILLNHTRKSDKTTSPLVRIVGLAFVGG